MGNQNFSTANDPHFKDPQTQQWSLSLDREIGVHNAFRFTYSGRRDRRLTLAPDLNQIASDSANQSRDEVEQWVRSQHRGLSVPPQFDYRYLNFYERVEFQRLTVPRHLAICGHCGVALLERVSRCGACNADVPRPPPAVDEAETHAWVALHFWSF